MVRQESNGDLAIWGTALWSFDKYIKEVRHVDAHQNSLPGVEGDWSGQADIPYAHLRCPPWSMK